MHCSVSYIDYFLSCLLNYLNKIIFKDLQHEGNSLNILLLAELMHQLLDQNNSI